MFNAREGAIRHEVPQRLLGSPPLKKGAGAGKSIDVELMVQGYYKGIGYRQDGRITSYNVCYTKLLRLSGSSTHPGGGVPTTIASGWIASKLIAQDD